MIILDGGLGQELVKRMGAATDLWSLQALIDAPEIVRDVHADFLAAGAEVIATNTYSLLPDRLDPKGLGDQLEALTKVACEAACAARDAHGSGLVGGSLGPLGFSYQPDQAPPVEEAAAVYARMARLHEAYVDLHMLETMSSIAEVRGGLTGAGVTGKPVWLSVSVSDEDGTKLRSGEDLADVLHLVAEFEPAALMVNCSVPEAVSQALPVIAPHLNIPFGAYANGFTGIHSDFNSINATVDLLKARTDLGPAAYLGFAQQWAALGATIIGGCCEVGPDHIRALADHFRN
ncbi:MAG: homocysteine S-methyltransferase family protein [Planktomarina sp.]